DIAQAGFDVGHAHPQRGIVGLVLEGRTVSRQRPGPVAGALGRKALRGARPLREGPRSPEHEQQRQQTTAGHLRHDHSRHDHFRHLRFPVSHTSDAKRAMVISSDTSSAYRIGVTARPLTRYSSRWPFMTNMSAATLTSVSAAIVMSSPSQFRKTSVIRSTVGRPIFSGAGAGG